MLARLDGYKTVAVGVAMLLYAGCGYALGYVDGQHAWEVILAGLAILGLRDAVRKAKPEIAYRGGDQPLPWGFEEKR